MCCVFMFRGCKSSVPVSQNVWDVMTCVQCNKQQHIYSERALSNRDNRVLKYILHKYSFFCWCMITPDISCLSGTVFNRLELMCSSPMEWGFYAGTKISIQKDICCYCIRKDLQADKELKKQLKTVLPLC